MLVHNHHIVSLLDMLLTYARAFAIVSSDLEFVRGQVGQQIAVGDTRPFHCDIGIGERAKESLISCRELCYNIPSLQIVTFEVDRLLNALGNNVEPSFLFNALEHLQHSIHDQLRSHYYYPVTPVNAELYHSNNPFGDEVFNRFPSAILDIQESGKCLALGQGTACVFHLMRVMEVALRVLSRELGITYAPSWESHISQITARIAEKHKLKDATWKRKQPLFIAILGDLTSIKTAWRNPTMHISRHYDAAEALEIYMAVNRLMDRMATKFREKGRPVAITVGLN